ncbi:hypothetical protein PTKIN_Ptkin05aG0204600 [Pterospermum kingtungense]
MYSSMTNATSILGHRARAAGRKRGHRVRAVGRKRRTTALGAPTVDGGALATAATAAVYGCRAEAVRFPLMLNKGEIYWWFSFPLWLDFLQNVLRRRSTGTMHALGWKLLARMQSIAASECVGIFKPNNLRSCRPGIRQRFSDELSKLILELQLQVSWPFYQSQMLKFSASDTHLSTPSKDSKPPSKPTSSNYKPNHLHILKKCTHLIQFKQVHAQIIKTPLHQSDTHLSKLIESLVGSAYLPYARLVFDQITEPSTFAFNTMIKGYGTNNLDHKGIDLYIRMRYQGLNPDNFTYPFLLKACNGLKPGKGVHSLVVKHERFSLEVHCLTSLITFYCSFGDVESARLLFDRMPEKNMVTWTGIIAGYVKQKRYKEGIELFHQMKNYGVEVNELTLVCVLSACANLGALEIGQWVHEYVDRKRMILNPKLGAALIDMYAKCGHIEKASQVFKTLPCDGVYVWNAMIGGLAMHGYGVEAIHRFRQMQEKGIKPDGITFIAVLSACSHSGLVEKGEEILGSMREDHKIEPNIKHYGCFVDLLCRAGLLNEAYEIIINMPIEPNEVLWGTLLNACAASANVELAEAAMQRLMVLEPFNDGNYVLMSNIYAAKERWDDVARIRKILKDGQIIRNPGHSLIQVNDVVHEFMVGDGRHPCSQEIYDMLQMVAITFKE